MSTTASAPHLHDRSLVRRLGFLGLPGERQGDRLTLDGLRTELGEQNASSLMIRIGELVKVHHLDQLGVSLDRAVTSILNSLTPEERASMATGNAVPARVEALISAEVEAAKAQDLTRKSHEANVDGLGLGPASLDRFAANRALSMRATDTGPGGGGGTGGDGRANYDSMAYNSAQSLQVITSSNYGRTPFATEGIAFGTFNYLRNYDRSFTGQNILHAANDTRALGFDVNDREAMTDHATIDRYSRDARGANRALQDYNTRVQADTELQGWVHAKATGHDGEKQGEWDAKITARMAQHRQAAKLPSIIATDTPKAGVAIEKRSKAIDLRYLKQNGLKLLHQPGAQHPITPQKKTSLERRAQLSKAERESVEKIEQEAHDDSEKRDNATRRMAKRKLLMDDDEVASSAPPVDRPDVKKLSRNAAPSAEKGGTVEAKAIPKPHEPSAQKQVVSKDSGSATASASVKGPDKPVAQARLVKPAGPSVA